MRLWLCHGLEVVETEPRRTHVLGNSTVTSHCEKEVWFHTPTRSQSLEICLSEFTSSGLAAGGWQLGLAVGLVTMVTHQLPHEANALERPLAPLDLMDNMVCVCLIVNSCAGPHDPMLHAAECCLQAAATLRCAACGSVRNNNSLSAIQSCHMKAELQLMMFHHTLQDTNKSQVVNPQHAHCVTQLRLFSTDRSTHNKTTCHNECRQSSPTRCCYWYFAHRRPHTDNCSGQKQIRKPTAQAIHWASHESRSTDRA
jgi:hypothetical protein